MKNVRNAVLAAFVAACLVPASSQAQMAYSTKTGNVSVTVVFIRDYVDPFDFQQVPRTYRYPSVQTYQRGQDEIRTNAAVRAALQKRGVPFRNVAGVQTAFSGGKIVYVR